MFSKYYQSELSYLRDLGREFAAANPALAGAFAERGGDPDVERLLEGFAFLTARIRERIDDAVPEVVESLCQLLLPQYIRPIPSCSVIEFTPQANALKGRHRLAAGTELGSRKVDGTSCLYRTTCPTDLLPMTLTDAKLDESVEAFPQITLSFQASESARALIFQSAGFRLFLHGPLGLASNLFLWMNRHLRQVVYRNGDFEKPLGASAVSPAGLGDDMPLLPWPSNAPKGMRLLQEYFTLPEKLLFLNIGNLEALAGSPGSDRFELVFQFERPPKLPSRIQRDNFRLHCAPVVNLFDTSTDPISVDPKRHEYLLRASGVNPMHASIYNVTGLTGLRGNRGGRVNYHPYIDFAHQNQSAEEQEYFSTRRAISPIDNGLDIYLSVMTPRDVKPQFHEETLSVDVTATNRLLPAELQVGDISQPTPRSPTIARFQNISRVTKPTHAPVGAELHWRLLSHLAVNQRSLSDPEILRAQLSLYNFFEAADKQTGDANRLRIESVRSVAMGSATRLMSQVPVRGIGSTIELDETSFAGEGDAFLFGCALDALFAHQAPINSFHELTVSLHPSGNQVQWNPKNGKLPIL